MTNREAISAVRNDPRMVNIDEYFPKRFIYNKLSAITSSFVKRDSDNRRVFNHHYLFKSIPVVKLIPDHIEICDDIEFSNSTKVSEIELPTTLSSIYGPVITIHPVLGYDGYEFVQTTSSKYKNILRRDFISTNTIYYWILNSKIYFPNAPMNSIRVEGAFTDHIALNKLLTNKSCVSILDSTFVCPDYLIDDVLKQTVTELLTYSQHAVDENPNMNINVKTTKNQ